MTVKELIKKLSLLDGDTRVLVSGYESGFCDLEEVSDIETYAADVNSVWYYGPHEMVDERHPYEGRVHFKGVLLQ